MKSKFTSLREAKLSKDQQKQIIGGRLPSPGIICTFTSGWMSRSSIYGGWAEANEACANPPSGFTCSSCDWEYPL